MSTTDTTAPLLFGDARLPDRFWSKVRVLGNGCWEWNGAKTSRGYGCLRRQGRLLYAHRVAREALVGPIPKGLESDHLCRNHACVHPLHIETVTHRVNLIRGSMPAVNRARQLAKTHCPQGHPYSGVNLYRSNGKRHCRTCRRNRDRSKACRNL